MVQKKRQSHHYHRASLKGTLLDLQKDTFWDVVGANSLQSFPNFSQADFSFRMSTVTLSSSPSWRLNTLPSETLGLIGELAGPEAVASLLCCGCKVISKRLLSSSGVSRIDIKRYARACTLWFPRFSVSMRGLKALKLTSDHFHGNFASVQRDSLISLPPTVESIDFTFINAELCWLSSVTSNKEGFIDSFSNPSPFPFHTVFPRLHTLKLRGNMRHMHIMSKKRRVWCWRALLAPNIFPASLIHLSLLSCNRVPCIALAYLPESLEHLHISRVSGLNLGAWIQRLTSLRVLHIPVWHLQADGDGLVYLPPSIVEFKMGGLDQKVAKDEAFLISSISQLPSSLTSFMLLEPLSKPLLQVLPRSLTKLDMAVDSMTISEFSNLSPSLTHLCVRTIRDLDCLAFRYLPKFLKTLELPQFTLQLYELEHLPANLTYLKLSSLQCGMIDRYQTSQEMIDLAPPNLQSIILTNDTWSEKSAIWSLKPKNLTFLEYRSYKQVVQWWQLGDSSVPWFEKMHGWSSAPIAVEYDAPEILEKLLSRGYSLYGYREDDLLRTAVKHGSMKILAWFEHHGFDMAWSAGSESYPVLISAISGGNLDLVRYIMGYWDRWFPDVIERIGDDEVDGYAQGLISEDETSSLDFFAPYDPNTPLLAACDRMSDSLLVGGSFKLKQTSIPSFAKEPTPMKAKELHWKDSSHSTKELGPSFLPQWPEDGFWDGRRRTARALRMASPQSRNPLTSLVLIQSIASSGLVEVMNWLVRREAGFSPKSLGAGSRQILMHSAAENQHWEMVQWLYLNANGEIDYRVLERVLNLKALQMLDWIKSQGVSVIKILKQGSKDTIRDWILSCSLPILKWLKQEGCQIGSVVGLPHFVCTYVPSPYIADWLYTTFDVSFDEPDPGDTTFRYFPIHIVTRAGNLPMLRWLRYAGVDMNAKDAKGNTALDIARSKGKTKIIQFLQESSSNAPTATNTDPQP